LAASLIICPTLQARSLEGVSVEGDAGFAQSLQAGTRLAEPGSLQKLRERFHHFRATLHAKTTAPNTGRHRIDLFKEPWETGIGQALYQRFLSNSVLSDSARSLARVQRVTSRLIAVSGRPDWNWEVKLVREGPTSAPFQIAGDPDQGFALPGGKIGVLSGMVALARTDDELAALLGHQMAHAIQRHMGERISEILLVQGGLMAAGAVVAPVLALAAAPATIMGISTLEIAYGTYYGLATNGIRQGTTIGFSGVQENEADRVGVMLMAKAGYDPKQAVRFWKRMASNYAEQPGQLPRGLMGKIMRSGRAVTPKRIARLESIVSSMASPNAAAAAAAITTAGSGESL
jgi:predicted Zn-dependent protease